MTFRICIPLYLLTLFLIGLGYLAILPPFEGFDETAHYSSVRQIADTKTIPSKGRVSLTKKLTIIRDHSLIRPEHLRLIMA
jgi:hypothetical protein